MREKRTKGRRNEKKCGRGGVNPKKRLRRNERKSK